MTRIATNLVILFFCIFIATDCHSQAQVINPGTTCLQSSRPGLRIDIYDGGTFRVYQGAYCENWSAMQVWLGFGDGSNAYASVKACNITNVEGSGTAGDPYKVEAVYQYTSSSGRKYTLIQHITYTYPNNYFFIDFEVLADGGSAAENVHIYVREDTAPGGADYARAWVDRSTNPTQVGGYRTAAMSGCTGNTGNASDGCSGTSSAKKDNAFLVYKSSTAGFTSYYTGKYSNHTQTPTPNFSNVCLVEGTNNCYDHCQAVHWNTGTYGPRQGKSKRMMLGYGNTTTDFNSISVADQTSTLNGSTPIQVSFEYANVDVPEGDVSNVPSNIRLKVEGGVLNGNQPVKLTATNGTATSSDYTLIPGFNIPAGNYTTPRYISIGNLTILGNKIIQNDRTFTLSISSDCGHLITSGTQASTIVTIKDDDCDKWSISASPNPVGAVTNPGGSTVTVALDAGVTIASGVSFNIVVDRLASSTAVDGTNYNTLSFPQTLSFSSGVTSRTFTVVPKNSGVLGAAPTTLAMRATNSRCTTPTRDATLTINDETDKVAANKVITLSVSPTSINRNSTGAKVSASLPSGITSLTPITIDLSSSSGATNYNFSSSTITIPPTNTSTPEANKVTVTGNCGTHTNETLAIKGTATGYTVNQASPSLTINGTGIGNTITANPATSPVCQGTNVTFTAPTGGASWQWLKGGTNIGSATSNTYTINQPAESGSYTVKVTNQYGCERVSDAKSITINPQPTLTLQTGSGATSQTVCSGVSIADIRYDITNATGATVTGLPTGVNFSVSGGVVTISGAPTASANTYTYTVTTTGATSPCTNRSLTGSIEVKQTPSISTSFANITPCNNATVSTTSISGSPTGTSYAWTGGASVGLINGNSTSAISSFTATNTGNTSTIATITVTPTTNGCTGTPKTYTVTVRPTPVVTVPSDITVCNGATVSVPAFTSSVTDATTTYSWTNSASSIGLVASGSGNISNFTATNSTSSPVTATIRVTPTSNTCSGTAQQFTITVNPTPTVTQPSNVTICGSETVAVNFTGNVTGGTYDWTNSNTSIGLGSSGTGNISFTATNNGTTDQTATITVTPKANGCTGTTTAKTFTITVKPKPVLSISSPTVTEGATLNFVLTLSASPCSQPITVTAATANGTAIAPGDYTGITAQTITFNPGETSKTFSVTTIDDQVIENTETMTVNLTNLSNNCTFNGGGTTLSATGTINDNDCDKFTVTVNNANIYGGPTTPQTATFTIALQSGYTTEVPFTITLNTTGSTAIAGTNYTTTMPASVSFSPANMTSKTFTVTAQNTNVIGSPLTTLFKVNGTTSLPCAAIKTAQTTINDESGNASNKAISITVDNSTIYEPELGGTPSVATVTVKLPGTMTSTTATRVYLSYTGSTATLTSDYTLNNANASTYIDIPANYNSVTFTITAQTDLFLEGDELIKIAGTAPTGYTMATGSDNISITLKDMTPGDVVIEKVQDGAEPGGAANKGQFRVKFKKDGVTCTKAVKVIYVVSGTALEGSDYSSLTPHEVTIPLGSHEVLIDVNVINNYIVDGNRSVILQITSAAKLP